LETEEACQLSGEKTEGKLSEKQKKMKRKVA